MVLCPRPTRVPAAPTPYAHDSRLTVTAIGASVQYMIIIRGGSSVTAAGRFVCRQLPVPATAAAGSGDPEAASAGRHVPPSLTAAKPTRPCRSRGAHMSGSGVQARARLRHRCRAHTCGVSAPAGVAGLQAQARATGLVRSYIRNGEKMALIIGVIAEQ